MFKLLHFSFVCLQTSDLGFPNTSDIELEFDWDEAFLNLETQPLQVGTVEGTSQPGKSAPVGIIERLKHLRAEELSKPRHIPVR